MRRQHLEHVLRAAARISGDGDVVVIGSQSILGTYDEQELPAAAVASIEADLAFFDDPDNRKSDLVDGQIGEDSHFHASFGYYGQGVSVDTATLPVGWHERVVLLETPNTRPGRGLCLEPHDLVVAKLVAGREKDFEFAAALLAAGLVELSLLRERTDGLSVVEAVRRRVHTWLEVWGERHPR